MPTILVSVAVLAYAIALFMWVRQRSFRYVAVLVAGHGLVLSAPLWMRFYHQVYATPGRTLQLFGELLPIWLVVSSSWLLPLPALLLFFVQRQGWWPRHYLAGLAAFAATFLYQLIMQGLAVRTGLWSFENPPQGWGNAYVLFIALLNALVSFGILYGMISTRHYAAEFAIPALFSGIIAAPLVVFGIVGAPFWLALLVSPTDWLLRGSGIVSVLLALWIVHLLCWGLHTSRLQQVRWG